MVSRNTESSGWADLKPLLSLGSTHQDTTSQKTLPGPFQQSVHPSSWTSAQPRAGHSNSPELFKQCCWRSEHPRSPQSTLLNLSLSPESPKCFNSNNNNKKKDSAHSHLKEATLCQWPKEMAGLLLVKVITQLVCENDPLPKETILNTFFLRGHFLIITL